jgi:SPP1 gp7 family putative phage head morphogenesis protein
LGYRLNWRSSEFQNRFFTNGGFPPFYVKLPEAATMKPEDQERIRTDFREKYLGLRNAWVPPILSRGATLESVGINQRDAEWLATQKATTWDILNIFQVPPEIAGYTEDANRSVSVEAKRKFWAGRIRSMGEHFASVIQRRVIDVFWPGLTFRFDWGAKFSEVMPEETRAAIESAGKLWAIGVPASEAFRVLGINVDVEGKPWLDDGFLPFGVMKASEINEEPREEQQDDDAADDQEDRRVRRLVTGLKDSSWPSPGTKLRDTLWRTYTARTDRAERRLRTDYGRFLSWLFDTAMTNLLGSGATQGRFANIDAVVRDETKRRIVPDDREVERKAKEATAQAQTFAARTGWDSVVNEIGVDDPFDITDPNVLRLLAQRSVQIAGAGVNAATRLRATLAEGVAAGETVDDLADRIRAKHREEYAGQARTVARTETMAAFSGARHEAMESHGISRHEWLSARDEVVRESHQIDGQTRAMGEPFTNGLLYPLDPSGSPGETVNCRCVALAVVS